MRSPLMRQEQVSALGWYGLVMGRESFRTHPHVCIRVGESPATCGRAMKHMELFGPRSKFRDERWMGQSSYVFCIRLMHPGIVVLQMCGTTDARRTIESILMRMAQVNRSASPIRVIFSENRW